MTKPNFIIAGEAKAGTTALYAYLGQHHEVFMCEPKEPRYFAFRNRRPDFAGPMDEDWVNQTTIYTRDDYFKLADRALFPLRCLVAPGAFLDVYRHPSSVVDLRGNLYVRPYGGGGAPSKITIQSGAHLELSGDFILGHGVNITLSPCARLAIGGSLNEPGSGITCNSMILVNKSISIGRDCIIAWDCCLTHSDWHDISYGGVKSVKTIPVVIGDRVWVGHGSSLLKRAVIGSGTIVAAKSTVLKGSYGKNILLAGNPAKQVKSDVEWAR